MALPGCMRLRCQEAEGVFLLQGACLSRTRCLSLPCGATANSIHGTQTLFQLSTHDIKESEC